MKDQAAPATCPQDDTEDEGHALCCTIHTFTQGQTIGIVFDEDGGLKEPLKILFERFAIQDLRVGTSNKLSPWVQAAWNAKANGGGPG